MAASAVAPVGLVMLKLRVKRLRQAWREVKIIFLGDSGFCRRHLPH